MRICHIKNRDFDMIYLHQIRTMSFHYFARVLFSRNSAYAKFRENKTVCYTSSASISGISSGSSSELSSSSSIFIVTFHNKHPHLIHCIRHIIIKQIHTCAAK